MALKRYVLLLAVIYVGHCDVIDTVKNVASDVSSFFGSKFKDAQSLFVNDQAELDTNFNHVKNLLSTIQDKMGVLKPMADDAQRAVLGKVGSMISDLTKFGTDVKDNASVDIEEKKAKWSDLVTRLFNVEGLSQLVKLVTAVTGGASPLYFCVLPMIMPVILAMRQ